MKYLSNEMPDPLDPAMYTKRRWQVHNMKLRYAFADSHTKGTKVLDISCGHGWGAAHLKPGRKTFALDINKRAISVGSLLWPHTKFVIGDMVNLPYANATFDTVICIEGYEHITKREQSIYVQEVHRVLSRNGIFIMTLPISYPNPDKRNPGHKHVPANKAEVEDNLKNHFNVILIENFTLLHNPKTKDKNVRVVGRKK
jgi:ubiquinone/menaquinone biosynthesis C-methylase UbiE